MLHDVLLTVHIIAGVVSLIAALVGVLSKAMQMSHRTHVISGMAFVIGMGTIFVTGMPLAFMGSSIFLGMVGIFGGYLALNGWRYARNRSGTPAMIDWLAVGLMLAVGIAMIVFGGLLLSRGQSMGTVLIVFGGIGVWLSSIDLRIFRAGGVKGRERIAQHLTMMLAGTIAALTAFSANFLGRMLPDGLGFIAWLWPTLLITPIITYWSRRAKAGLVGLA